MEFCFDPIRNIRRVRERLHKTQEEFWIPLGVTQSGGSRYESGRDMPKPVRALIWKAHKRTIDSLNGRSR